MDGSMHEGERGIFDPAQMYPGMGIRRLVDRRSDE